MLNAHAARFVGLQPALATSLNLSEELAGDYHARLPDYSPPGMREMQDAMLGAHDEITALDVSALTPDDQRHVAINAEIDLYYAGSSDFRAGYIDTWGGHLPYIVNQIGGPLIDIPRMLQEQHQIHGLADARAYVHRLAAFATMIRQVEEKVTGDARAGVILPSALFEPTLAYLRGFIEPEAARHTLVTTFDERLADLADVDDTTRGALRGEAEGAVASAVYPAVAHLIEVMTALRSRAPSGDGVWAQPGGAQMYDHELRFLADTDLDPDAIHALGLREVERISNEIDSILVANERTGGSVAERLAALAHDPRFIYEDSDRGREQLLDELNRQIAEVMKRAPDLFHRLPKYEVVVQRIPPVAEAGAPGGYYEAPALDGSRPGQYAINLRDMAEVPSYTLKTLTYHEAVPGHHFQTALAMEQADIGLMRQNSPFNAYVEGWALYAERLAEEIGMYRDDPWGNVGRLQDELLRAVRLVVDTGLHHERWTRQQAIDYFHHATGIAMPSAISEVERYMAWPGQALGYKLGMVEILRLRDLARDQLGDRFDLRAFHDVVLVPGARPLRTLRSDVQQWVQSQLASQD